MSMRIKSLLLVCSAIIFGVFITINIKIAIIITLIFIFLAATFIDYKSVLLALLFMRSSFDIFNDINLGIIKISSIIGISIIILLLFVITTKQILLNRSIVYCFLNILVIMAISCAFSNYLFDGIDDWLKFASIFSIYILVYNIIADDEQYTSKIINVILYSSYIPLAIGVFQYITNNGTLFSQGYYRVQSTFVHPNPFAFYLVVIITTLLMTISKKEKYPLFKLILLLLSIFELITTYTRGAWLGLLLIITLLILFSNSKKRSVYFIILICLVVFIISFSVVLKRFDNLFSNRVDQSSLAFRISLWSKALSMIGNRLIIGYGLGSFSRYSTSIIGFKTEAHNEYLRILFETGIFGLLEYLVLYFLTLKLLFRQIKLHNKKSLYVFVLVISFLFMSFGDNIADNLVSQLYLWSLIAIGHNSMLKERSSFEYSFSKQVFISKRG